MEQYYFIEKDGAKLGPLKLNNLRSYSIYSDDLVWRSDTENWKKASEFEELNGIFIIKPLSTPREQENAEITGENSTTKKTVNISEQLIVSTFLGFMISLLIVILSHVFPSDWMAMPITNGSQYFTYADKVSGCSYKCLFGERHGANCTGLTMSEVNEKSLTVDEIFSASFEHWSLIIIIGLIISTIIYIIKRVNFQVVKE